MPEFHEAMQEALDTFYSEQYATPAKYNGKDIFLIEESADERSENHMPEYITDSTVVWVRKSDVDSPKPDDLVEFKGDKWRVASGYTLTNNEWRIILVREGA